MKYYKIEIQSFFENHRISSDADGDKIFNARYYFEQIGKGEIMSDVTLFDYFTLFSYDKYIYWEWHLFDVFRFTSEAGRMHAWLISEDFKNLLENFKLSQPHHFYHSKLLYKGEKLDYYIFQFAGKAIVDLIRTKYIDWTKSILFNPIDKSYLHINSTQEFVDKSLKIMRDSSYDKEIQLKKLTLTEELDFFPMATFLHDDIVSERLKNAIETMGIEGFEFSELDYEVSVAQ